MSYIRIPFNEAFGLLIDLLDHGDLKGETTRLAAYIINSFDNVQLLRNEVIQFFGDYQIFKSCEHSDKLIELFGAAILGDDGCVI